MIESLPEEIKKANKKRFEQEMLRDQNIDPEQILGFLSWLDGTDFYEAPASTGFHNNIKGGLCQHSLNVLDAGIKLNQDYNLGLPKTDVIFACLLHDLCKTNFYIEKEVWDKKHKDETNE